MTILEFYTFGYKAGWFKASNIAYAVENGILTSAEYEQITGQTYAN